MNVLPAQIEEKLVSIWDDLQGRGKVRACLFNLIVYSSHPQRAQYLEQVVQKLLQKYPSRVIFIHVDENQQEIALKTSVSVISIEEGVACDLISIELSNSTKERAPFLVLPHLLPDLPIYLMWGDDPSEENPIAHAIGKFASRIIFDSESASHLDAFAKGVLALQKRCQVPIADLNWARIEPWRHMLKAVFSDPLRTPLLDQVTEIHLVYNGCPTAFFSHNKIQGLYLQGWISQRLGWKISTIGEDGDTTCFSFDSPHGHISLFLTPKDEQNSPPGRILSLKFITENEESCFFERCEKPPLVKFEHSTPDRCDMPIPFPFDKYESGQSLAQEIFKLKENPHFLSLLQHLSTLKELTV